MQGTGLWAVSLLLGPGHQGPPREMAQSSAVFPPQLSETLMELLLQRGDPISLLQSCRHPCPSLQGVSNAWSAHIQPVPGGPRQQRDMTVLQRALLTPSCDL